MAALLRYFCFTLLRHCFGIVEAQGGDTESGWGGGQREGKGEARAWHCCVLRYSCCGTVAVLLLYTVGAWAWGRQGIDVAHPCAYLGCSARGRGEGRTCMGVRWLQPAVPPTYVRVRALILALLRYHCSTAAVLLQLCCSTVAVLLYCRGTVAALLRY